MSSAFWITKEIYPGMFKKGSYLWNILTTGMKFQKIHYFFQLSLCVLLMA